MRLILLRHALALEAGTHGVTRDADRPLAPKGERNAARAADALEALGLDLDLILSSPLLRARQTAEIVAKAMDKPKLLELTNTLAPGGSFQKLAELINRKEPPRDAVLLVGHEPYLSDLVALLVFGEARAGVVMKKSGLCGLWIEGALKAGRCAQLEWLLTPKQMRILG